MPEVKAPTLAQVLTLWAKANGESWGYLMRLPFLQASRILLDTYNNPAFHDWQKVKAAEIPITAEELAQYPGIDAKAINPTQAQETVERGKTSRGGLQP